MDASTTSRPQDVRKDATPEDPADAADALGTGRHGGRPEC